MSSVQRLLALFVAYASAAAVPQSPLLDVNASVALTAGIGAEFESASLRLIHEGCTHAEVDPIKGHMITGRQGDKFKLTVDTDPLPTLLHPEYHLDGKTIKVGSGDAARVGAAAAKDFADWKPWDLNPVPKLTVEDSKCNPWTIKYPPAGTDPLGMRWEPQITAAMPLEAIYRLMQEQKADPRKKNRNVLNGGDSTQPLIVVEREYFQAYKIDATKLTDDVLGFCSLVMTYAKNVNDNEDGIVNSSPKDATSLMPRTEFNTLYNQVKAKFPPNTNLAELFDSLACYRTDGNEVVLDEEYCTGLVYEPESTGLFRRLTYINKYKKDARMNVINWIDQIGKGGPGPDLLTKFDQSFDSSIGGYGPILEKMYQSDREVPLFEFRNLEFLPTKEFESFMKSADESIQKLHLQFRQAPRVSKYSSSEQEL